jgi:hypothetical protein
VGIARTWNANQALRAQRAQQGSEGVSAGPGHSSLHHPRSPAYRVHTVVNAPHAANRVVQRLLYDVGRPSILVEHNRAEYAKQRREMLQFWSDYLDRLAPAADLLLSPEELHTRPVLAFSRVA